MPEISDPVSLKELLNEQGEEKPVLIHLDESGQVIDTKYCFILAKNKRGECAELPITFDGTYQRFKEVADYE